MTAALQALFPQCNRHQIVSSSSDSEVTQQRAQRILLVFSENILECWGVAALLTRGGGCPCGNQTHGDTSPPRARGRAGPWAPAACQRATKQRGQGGRSCAGSAWAVTVPAVTRPMGAAGLGEGVSGKGTKRPGAGEEAEWMRLLLFADGTESQPGEAPELSGQLFTLVRGCLASEGRSVRGRPGPGPRGDCVPAAYPLTVSGFSGAKGHEVTPCSEGRRGHRTPREAPLSSPEDGAREAGARRRGH